MRGFSVAPLLQRCDRAVPVPSPGQKTRTLLHVPCYYRRRRVAGFARDRPMRLMTRLSLWSVLLSAGSVSAATIGYEVTHLSGNLWEYQYSVSDLSGITFLANETTIDINFDQSLYGTLSNGVTNSDFDLVLLQPPSQPPGAPGQYSAQALIDNPSLTGDFSVEFQYLGTGTPGSQPFTIDNYDPTTGFLMGTVARGTTSLPDTVPEPSVLLMCCAGFVAIALLRWRRLRLSRGQPSTN